MSNLNKLFGENTVVRLTDASKELFEVKVVPTGILSLDLALGVGGLPRGRTIELYGSEGSGKSTIALYAAASAQRLGDDVAYLDAEQAFDLELARAYGVNEDKLILCQPASGEQAIDIAESLLRAGVSLVVVDSVSALIPTAEASGTMEDNFVGLHARLMSKAMRKLTPAMNSNREKRGTVIFINQFREKVGMMYGDPRVTTGGRALRFFASVRIEVASGSKEDRIMSPDGKEQIGQIIHMRIVKNKVAPPYKEAEANLIYGVGIDQVDQVVRTGVKTGLIARKGAFYSINGVDKSVQGQEKLTELISSDAALRERLEQKIRAVVSSHAVEQDDA